MSDDQNSSTQSESSGLPRWLNKWTIGAFAVVLGVAGAVYTLTRPTKPKKIRTRRPDKPKTRKYEKDVSRKPLDIHLVMRDISSGLSCHVAADKKNKKMELVVGSALVKINGAKVENMSFDQIQIKLQSARFPVTLTFREYPELQRKWEEADQLKEQANDVYKKNRVDEALAIMQQAIDLHSTNKVYYSNRVLMLLRNQDYDAALTDCQTMRELDPLSLYVKGHYLRGLTLMNLGKYKHARSAFQTVLKINANFKKASERLEECLQKLAEIDQNPEEDQKEPDEDAAVEQVGDGVVPAQPEPALPQTQPPEQAQPEPEPQLEPAVEAEAEAVVEVEAEVEAQSQAAEGQAHGQDGMVGGEKDEQGL